MVIGDIYYRLLDYELYDNLKGDVELHKKSIVWEYRDCDNNLITDVDEYDDDYMFNMISSEESLLDAYHNDIEILNNFFDNIEITDVIEISNYTIKNDRITFKILLH